MCVSVSVSGCVRGGGEWVCEGWGEWVGERKDSL